MDPAVRFHKFCTLPADGTRNSNRIALAIYIKKAQPEYDRTSVVYAHIAEDVLQ
jgi:hypothetical protein